MTTPAFPSTQWQEKIKTGEAARLEKYAAEIHALQLRNAGKGPVRRALHAKTQLGLKAEFEVMTGLHDFLKVGLFASVRTYKAYVRFSNGAGVSASDRKGDARGIALKLLGIPGKKILPGLEEAPTQDFLLIRDPAIPFRDADEFVPFILNIGSPILGLPRIFLKLGFCRALQILKKAKAGLSRPTFSLATTHYFSAAPIRFGPYAVHYSLKPLAIADSANQPGETPDFLSEEMSRRLEKGPVQYDFGVQFYLDETRTPIEDASVEWKEAQTPFIPLARLTLLRQETTSPSGLRLHDFIDKLSFDPWHAPLEFQPLGNIMRARRVAYKASVQGRGLSQEPDGTASFE